MAKQKLTRKQRAHAQREKAKRTSIELAEAAKLGDIPLQGDLSQAVDDGITTVSTEPAVSAPDIVQSAFSLPDDAWVAMERSGGLAFKSDTVVVYNNGYVTHQDNTLTLAKPNNVGIVNSNQYNDLTRLLTPATFADLPAKITPSPDAIVISLAARVNGEVVIGEQSRIALSSAARELVNLLVAFIPAPQA